MLEKHKAVITNWNQIVGEKYNNISTVNKDKMEKAKKQREQNENLDFEKKLKALSKWDDFRARRDVFF